GRFRLSVAGEPYAADALVPTAVREVLKTPAEERSPAQTDVLFAHWRTTVADWKPQNDEIEVLWQSHPRPTSQLVLRERDDPRIPHMLTRGDLLNPRHPVP